MRALLSRQWSKPVLLLNLSKGLGCRIGTLNPEGVFEIQNALDPTNVGPKKVRGTTQAAPVLVTDVATLAIRTTVLD